MKYMNFLNDIRCLWKEVKKLKANNGGGSDYVLPIATESVTGGVKSGVEVMVDPITGKMTIDRETFLTYAGVSGYGKLLEGGLSGETEDGTSGYGLEMGHVHGYKGNASYGVSADFGFTNESGNNNSAIFVSSADNGIKHTFKNVGEPIIDLEIHAGTGIRSSKYYEPQSGFDFVQQQWVETYVAEYVAEQLALLNPSAE